MTLLDDARAWFDALAPAPDAWLSAQRARAVRWQWFDGEVADPEPLRGWFPLSRSSFVQCEPFDACEGGPLAACAVHYSGDRCASCAEGSYR